MKELLDKDIELTRTEYTMTELANLFGITKEQANRFMKRYEVPQYRKGYDKRVRVLKSDDIARALDDLRGEWPVRQRVINRDER